MKTIPTIETPTIPTFEFREKDAAKPASARAWVQALVATGKFARNEKSTICYTVGKPDDYIYVVRKEDLTALVQDEVVIRVTGDLGDACNDCLWMWLTARKHLLTRLNPERPWVDSRPKFENRGRDCA